MSRDNKAMDEKNDGTGVLASGRRWGFAHKRGVVMRLLRGQPLDLVSRELDVDVSRLERWEERALRFVTRSGPTAVGYPTRESCGAEFRWMC